MRMFRKFQIFILCLTIIFILFANASNAYQELNFRPSSSKDIIIWLNAKNIRKEGDKSKADVVLVNNKGTWVYVKQDFSEGKFPVPTEGAYLIGPNYIKNLGAKEFTKGSFIKFNAETAIGVGHRLGSPESNMLLGALAIDLAMRGFFSKELPPNAFDRPLVLPIEVGMASIDPLFYTITSHCSGPLGVFSKAVIMKDADKAIEALGKFLICTTEAPVREKIKEWLIKLFSKDVAEKWARIFVGNIGDFVNVPLKATLIELITKNTFAAPPEGWARIEAVEAVNRLQIISYLRILEPSPYKVGGTITAEFSIKNIGTAPITFDVLTVGGRVNDTCPQDICPDFTWKENITLQSNGIYPYKGKLRLEASGNYHFFTAYRTKEGWNTAIPTAIGATNTKDIFVKPIEWRECKLGTLVFSVPPDWKVVIREEDSFVAGSTEDYRDRRYVSFMVGVANLGDAFKDVEQEKTRIIHYGSNGGEVEEPGNPPIITIGHMGRLVDSFKAEIANRPVTICVLHLTEKEGMVVEGVKFTNWSFALIDGGKHYAFSLTSVDPAFQSAMFSQLVSKIHLLSQTTKKPVSKFLIPLKEGTYEKAQGFKGTVYKGLFHLGRDYCVKKAGVNKNGSLSGTTVYPIADGTVVDLRFNKYPAKDSEKWKKGDGVGNYVSIDHGNGIVAVYMHLAKVEVSRGQKVTAQTPLGEAGDIILHPEDPGKMCPHLHLEIRKNGVTSLHVPPNLRYGYISQDGTTKIEEGNRIENVLGWIDLNFYDPDSILATRKTSPASAMRILFIGQEQKDSAFTLFAINSDGSELTKILTDVLSESRETTQITLSPDGKEIAAVSSRERKTTTTAIGMSRPEAEIRIISLDGRVKKTLPLPVSLGGYNEPKSLRWSPDGAKIVFTSGNDVYMINADGTGLTRLTNDGDNYNPNWWPDSKRIVFDKHTREGWKSYLIHIDGRRRVEPANLSSDVLIVPEWSPDGGKIAFIREGTLWVGKFRDGKITEPKRLTKAASLNIRWSKDGSKIAFMEDFVVSVTDSEYGNPKPILQGGVLLGWTATDATEKNR